MWRIQIPKEAAFVNLHEMHLMKYFEYIFG
jgi:hypothetical protein